jgi:hypothetical protein
MVSVYDLGEATRERMMSDDDASTIVTIIAHQAESF